jgi:hypothetical protein
MYETHDKSLSHLPRSLRIGGPMRQPFLPYATTEKPHPFQRKFHSSLAATMDGLEVAKDRTAKISMGEVELLTRRLEGMQRTMDIIYEQITNNRFPVEESEFIVQCLEKRADLSLRQTYIDGRRVSEVCETATTLRVAITLMAGADSPQVNRFGQVGMTSEIPDQKSATWRVNTASTLLNDFGVDTDLSIIQADNTAHVIARSRERKLLADAPNFASNNVRLGLLSRRCDDRTVTIHSDHVEIVHALTGTNWDLESTLIEVDGSSLTSLIVNYRHLIYRGGPALSFAETVMDNLTDLVYQLTRSHQIA